MTADGDSVFKILRSIFGLTGKGSQMNFLLTFVTSRYVGGLVLNEEDGGQIVVSNSVFRKMHLA